VKNISPSVLLSIFKRKGGEGLRTKVITEENKHLYDSTLQHLGNEEKAVIVYQNNEHDWILLTDQRLVVSSAGHLSSLPFSDITAIHPTYAPPAREFGEKIQATRLKLFLEGGQSLILNVEDGAPFQGWFHVLDYAKGRY
jgi:hypothetical protein